MGWKFYDSTGALLQGVADGSITNAKMATDSIDSPQYVDGSIDNEHLADDAVDSDELAAGAVDTAHIGPNQVTAAKIFDLARGSVLVGNASAATAELTIGSNTNVLTSDGTDIAWAAAGSGAVAREGGNTSEASSTSTSEEDIFAAASLTIAAAQPITIQLLSRKTAISAARPQVGVNLTTASGNADIGRVYPGDNAEAVEQHQHEITVPARVSNYLRAGPVWLVKSGTSAGTNTRNQIETLSASSGVENDYPTAEITSVVIDGLITAQTLFVDELQVYSWAVS